MEAQPNLFVVSVDNYAGGRMATEHLLDQGYRRIGHISGPLDWWEARQRRAGWHDALTDAGLTPTKRLCVQGNWSPASGERALQGLLSSNPDLDAVFAANDQMALGVLYATKRIGLSVPHQLALVGFDGIPESAYFAPPLTTLYHDLGELGSRAVRELVGTIEANHRPEVSSKPRAVSLQPALVVRESSMKTEV
jgi:LacI family transcriptional regulator